MLDECFLKLRNESVFIFGYLLLHFSPSGRAVLVPYTYNAMNRFVNFLLVLCCDCYFSPLEDLLQMPEIACQRKSRVHTFISVSSSLDACAYCSCLAGRARSVYGNWADDYCLCANDSWRPTELVEDYLVQVWHGFNFRFEENVAETVGPSGFFDRLNPYDLLRDPAFFSRFNLYQNVCYHCCQLRWSLHDSVPRLLIKRNGLTGFGHAFVLHDFRRAVGFLLFQLNPQIEDPLVRRFLLIPVQVFLETVVPAVLSFLPPHVFISVLLCPVPQLLPSFPDLA